MSANDRADDILTALVIIISGQIADEKKARGVTRVGGDYTAEAVSLIRQKREHVISLLG